MKMLLRWFPVVLLCNGCASIISQSTYPVTFDSNPTGATIVIMDHDGTRLFEGPAPTTLTLLAKRGFFQGARYTIEASQDGYNTGRATLHAKLDGWYISNIFFGGLLGFLIIDPATGAMWKLDARVAVNLGAATNSSVAGDHQLAILSVDQIPRDYLPQLIRIPSP